MHPKMKNLIVWAVLASTFFGVVMGFVFQSIKLGIVNGVVWGILMFITMYYMMKQKGFFA